MAFKRVRFFAGQLLSAEDLEAEQTYQREKRQLHNRLLHRPGVVSGLQVSLDGAGESAVIVVSPGFAIDPLGNEILIDEPVRLTLDGCTAEQCFVTLVYTETPTDPVPTSDGMEFSRVLESFAVEVREREDDKRLGLARLMRKPGGWELA